MDVSNECWCGLATRRRRRCLLYGRHFQYSRFFLALYALQLLACAPVLTSASVHLPTLNPLASTVVCCTQPPLFALISTTLFLTGLTFSFFFFFFLPCRASCRDGGGGAAVRVSKGSARLRMMRSFSSSLGLAWTIPEAHTSTRGTRWELYVISMGICICFEL